MICHKNKTQGYLFTLDNGNVFKGLLKLSSLLRVVQELVSVSFLLKK